MKTQDLLIWGAVGVGAYFLWTQMAGASTTGAQQQPQQGSQGINAGGGYGSQVPPWASNYGSSGFPAGGGLPGGYGAYGGYGGPGWSGGGMGPWGVGTSSQPGTVNGIGHRRRIRVN